MRGLFVTGTGTEVGKTVVASAIAHAAHAAGDRVAVFKPAVSGLDDHPLRPEVWASAAELPDHALLRLAAGSRQGDEQIAPYRYGPAVSPHLGAEMAGERIDPDRLRGAALGEPTSTRSAGQEDGSERWRRGSVSTATDPRPAIVSRFERSISDGSDGQGVSTTAATSRPAARTAWIVSRV